MARFRSIDPEFWQQPQFSITSLLARLLVLGLMSQADDHGRVPCNPAFVQGILFPFGRRPTTDKLSKALGELGKARELHLYAGPDGRDYALLLGWKNAASWQYQVIQRRSSPRYPEPVGGFPNGLVVDCPRRPPAIKEPPPQKVGKGRR